VKALRAVVILPVYNRATFLPVVIDSLTCQTFQEFAVVAVDDASTDNSYDLLVDAERQAPERWHVFRNTRNVGGAANVNRCIALQREMLPGIEYLVRLDSSCVLAREQLASGVAALDRNPAAVLCHFRTLIVTGNQREDTADSGFARQLAVHGWSRHISHTMPPADALRMFIRYDNFVSSVGGAFIRRSALESLEWPWHDESFLLADYELWTRLASSGAICYIADVTTQIMRAPEMTSTMATTPIAALQLEARKIALRALKRSWRTIGPFALAGLIPIAALKLWYLKGWPLLPFKHILRTMTCAKLPR